jgi:hypothetical protein
VTGKQIRGRRPGDGTADQVVSGVTGDGDNLAAMEDGRTAEEEQGHGRGGRVHGRRRQLGCRGSGNDDDRSEGDGSTPANFSSLTA